VECFNSRWLLEAIRNVSPAEFEALYYQQEEAPVKMAGLK